MRQAVVLRLVVPALFCVITAFEASAQAGQAGSYDGDALTDLAVWRPSDGVWRIIRSATGNPFVQQWGVGGDIPVPGDYDGDGLTDVAVFRPKDGTWYINRSFNSTNYTQEWGVGGDI